MTVYREPERSDFWQLARGANGKYLDPLGPLNCTTHSMARLVMRHYEGKRPAGTTGAWPPTGAVIRQYTGDTIGGTNLSQMGRVAQARYGFNLDIRYRLPWDAFVAQVEAGRGAILQLWYAPIRDSKYRGSTTFGGNHAVYVNEVDRARQVFRYVVDPLADGRQAGLYKGPGGYPFSLLRNAAGKLNIAGAGYTALGTGLVYAAFSQVTVDVPDVSTEEDMTITRIKGEDWNPTVTGAQSNGVIRGAPRRDAAIIYRYPATAIVRSIAEISVDAPAPNHNWRLTEWNDQPAYMLRTDWEPVAQGGDPTVDQALTDYIARK